MSYDPIGKIPLRRANANAPTDMVGKMKRLEYNTFEYHTPDARVIRHNYTDILTFYEDGRITLNADGWRSATTKKRLNTYLPSHWMIYQEKGNWYLRDCRHGIDYYYEDGTIINGDRCSARQVVKPIPKFLRKLADYLVRTM